MLIQYGSHNSSNQCKNLIGVCMDREKTSGVRQKFSCYTNKLYMGSQTGSGENTSHSASFFFSFFIKPTKAALALMKASMVIFLINCNSHFGQVVVP